MGGMGDDLSVISETPSVFTGKVTHAEKNLSKIEGNRAKELENVKRQLAEREEELAQLKQKHQGVVARSKTLEGQVREVKQQFSGKIQILIEKTENDDKLIAMLKHEISRLEQVKSVKSTINSGVKLQPLTSKDELAKAKGEVGFLKNKVRCMEVELEQKEEKIQNLMSSCLGAPDERLEENELRIVELEEKVESLEKENFRIREEAKT